MTNFNKTKIKMMIGTMIGEDQIDNVGAMRSYTEKKMNAKNAMTTLQNGLSSFVTKDIELNTKQKKIGLKK